MGDGTIVGLILRSSCAPLTSSNLRIEKCAPGAITAMYHVFNLSALFFKPSVLQIPAQIVA